MIDNNNFNDISKEVLTVLSYWEIDLINKIPNSLMNELVDYAADSKKECFIDTNMSLQEQNISEESKDLIALIYYSFIANEDTKKEIKKIWDINEEKYQEDLQKKYNINNIFKKKNIDNNENTDLIEYKEENNFIKFIKKIISKINNLNYK